ncbi:hypothetical protein PL8927_880043 [Planktothrix serta PCC 8927]|uniref:Uncharacterized protein n=1 Tax=Planktothrix serta PCC 8927 TaxID=671068 RepID=A0A7Z9BZ54_9CYAN|nr:hypothetical protein PL8927_880043 [Planktothrix serta PCC 8927]
MLGTMLKYKAEKEGKTYDVSRQKKLLFLLMLSPLMLEAHTYS